MGWIMCPELILDLMGYPTAYTSEWTNSFSRIQRLANVLIFSISPTIIIKFDSVNNNALRRNKFSNYYYPDIVVASYSKLFLGSPGTQLGVC